MTTRLAALLALLLLTAPVNVAGQQAGKLWKIGLVWETVPAASQPLFEPLRRALNDLGYVEGRSVVFEQRWAKGKRERVPDLLMDLARLNVDILALPSNPLIAAGKQATVTRPIPIVMLFAADPVGAGFVSSLARPGGNITGLSSTVSPEIVGKLVELLKEARPEISRVGFLYDPTVAGVVPFVKAMAPASQNFGLTLVNAKVGTPDEIHQAFQMFTRERVGAVVVYPSPLTVAAGRQIAQQALEQRVAAAAAISELIQPGYLLAYGPSFGDLSARAAVYIDHILKGTPPGDLPIEQPTRFRLVINLSTAKTLGLKIPQSLLLRADQVIE